MPSPRQDLPFLRESGIIEWTAHKGTQWSAEKNFLAVILVRQFNCGKTADFLPLWKLPSEGQQDASLLTRIFLCLQKYRFSGKAASGEGVRDPQRDREAQNNMQSRNAFCLAIFTKFYYDEVDTYLLTSESRNYFGWQKKPLDNEFQFKLWVLISCLISFPMQMGWQRIKSRYFFQPGFV